MSVLGAGALVFLGALSEEFDRADPSTSSPGELLIVIGGVGAIAGLAAIYGVWAAVRKYALVGAGSQGLVAVVLLLWVLVDGRADIELFVALFSVIVIDVLAVIHVRSHDPGGLQARPAPRT